MRTRSEILADLQHANTAAKRLPVTHPDHEAEHLCIDSLLTELQRATPVRPSQVLAETGVTP